MILLVSCLAFTGCVMEGENDPNIEKSAEKAKTLIEQLTTKAKDVLDNKDGELDKVKELIDNIAEKSKEVAEKVKEKGPELKEKIDSIKNDPDLKNKLENFKGDAGELLKELEGILKDAVNDLDKKDGGATESGDGIKSPAEKMEKSDMLKNQDKQRIMDEAEKLEKAAEELRRKAKEL